LHYFNLKNNDMAADIQPAVGRKKRLVPRVDLTPLVDLAFLLITFFVFTTTLSTPTALTTILPADSTDSTRIPASGAVTLIAGSNCLLYQVPGMSGFDTLQYQNPDSLRSKLLSLRQQLIALSGNDDKLFVTIKPAPQSQLQHVVQLFDEMQICQVRRYALTDLNEPETAAFAGL
jgi:biopolymer transport protein ExbD